MTGSEDWPAEMVGRAAVAADFPVPGHHLGAPLAPQRRRWSLWP